MVAIFSFDHMTGENTIGSCRLFFLLMRSSYLAFYTTKRAIASALKASVIQLADTDEPTMVCHFVARSSGVGGGTRDFK